MGHSADRSEQKRFLSDLFSRPESLPLLLFILFFAILYGAGPDLRSSKFIFDPPWLLIVLNTVFVMGLCLLIAGLCFRSFLRVGFLNVLLLGCGVLAFGLTSFAAAWLIRPPYGLNEAVTIRNIGVLCTAAFFFLSSLFTAFGISMEIEHRRGLVAGMAYTAMLGLGVVLTAGALLELIPPFFIAGEGPTVIRQVVLAVSVTLFSLSAILMMMVYSEKRSGFLLYFINALLLFGAGIVGVSLGVPGSPLSWLGRAAQYMGNVYLVVASMQALVEARSRGTTVEKALAGFFRKSEAHYKSLVELAADAIVSIDHKGKIILMNPAAEETFGYSRYEAFGQSLAELIVPEQSRDSFHACLSGESRRDMEMELARKDGSIFPAELSFSPEMKSEGGSERTIIIRDVTGRRQAEEALRSAALFPIQNPEPVLRIHRDGTLLFSNPAAETVLKEWRAASGTGVPAQLRQAVEAALSEGIARDVEVQIAGRDFSFVVTPIVKNHYANLYGGDVTESKRAEEALRKSEARLRLAHDAGKAGTWEWDLRTHENIWSEELWKLYGLDPHDCEPTYETWRQTIHPDDRAKTEQIVQEAATLGAELNAEWRVRDRDGSIRWLMSRGQPQHDVEGRPMRYIGIVVDITGRKRAEQALRGSEARYRSHTEVTGQLGWTTDADGEIVEDAPAFQQYTGQTSDEIRGWGWSKALHPDDLEITLAVWRKAVEDKQGYETEYRLRRHDGVYRYFLARGVPILNVDGSVREWVGTCIDITERNQAEKALKISEEALRIANEELEQRVRERTAELMLILEDLEKSRNDLRKLASELVLAEERERKKISVILHDEVAQTLAAARMRIDLLRRMPGDDDSRRALDEAQQLLVQAIRETRALMTDISNPVLYDMGLQVAVQSLAEEVKARNGISFSSSFSGNLKTLEKDVEVMLFQLVKELVQNIVKHSGARKASIRIVEERDDIKVVVADDGLGFDAGNIGAVGLDGGFGLFSIRERVKSYHGKIKIESEPGKGAEVTVMLPKKAAGVAASRKTGKRKEKI